MYYVIFNNKIYVPKVPCVKVEQLAMTLTPQSGTVDDWFYYGYRSVDYSTILRAVGDTFAEEKTTTHEVSILPTALAVTIFGNKDQWFSTLVREDKSLHKIPIDPLEVTIIGPTSDNVLIVAQTLLMNGGTITQLLQLVASMTQCLSKVTEWHCWNLLEPAAEREVITYSNTNLGNLRVTGETNV